MKTISTILIAMVFSLTAISADKAKKECVKNAKVAHKAAEKECKAKPKAERKDCQKAAKSSYEEAKKACNTAPKADAAAPAPAPTEPK